MNYTNELIYDEAEFLAELDEIEINFNPAQVDNAELYENRKHDNVKMNELKQLHNKVA